MTFPYATADRAAIEARAKSFVGLRLIDIDPNAPMRPSSPQTKGVVGGIYERAFGIPPNSIPGPDFPGAAIELKSVPIRLVGGETRAKERISVGMIDFVALETETWATASVRKKLDDILLVFYRWDPLLPIARFETLAAGIWAPDGESLEAIRSDWEAIQRVVLEGRREELSEGLTTVLGAATKGPGHGSRSRAWSLKQSFVGWIFEAMTGQALPATAGGAGDPGAAFEAATLARLRSHVGRSMADLAVVSGRAGKVGKAGAASIVRALIGERFKGRHGEFERFGIEVKTVPVDRRGRIVESMSFPAFVHEELVFETWETSDLLDRLNRMLIVPIHRERKAQLGGMVLGRPFFWNPSGSELAGIQREWEDARSLIERGRADHLPTRSQTGFIHVRTHGRDSSDRDQAPGGLDVAKKSFWLNDHYLRQVLASHDALTPPLPPPPRP